MILKDHRSIRIRNGEVTEIDDIIVVEDQFQILFNDLPVTDIVASRDQLPELGAGFVITEGLTRCVDKVKLEGNRILVYADTGCDVSRSKKELGSSGGMSIQKEPRTVSSGIKITPEDVILWTREIETEVWRKTGAVHCSVLFYEGKCLVKSSDIGRHNTVDKVVGHAILNRIDLSGCVIGCTGRQPAGMVKKYANAGIPVVISRAASTDKRVSGSRVASGARSCSRRSRRARPCRP